VAYLDGLAKRLAAAACIPPALARKRVMALAISAKPRMEGYRRGGQ
jgi:hypothetical protein